MHKSLMHDGLITWSHDCSRSRTGITGSAPRRKGVPMGGEHAESSYRILLMAMVACLFCDQYIEQNLEAD